MTQNETALDEYRPAAATDLVPFIDVEREQLRLQNFRDFVHGVLSQEKGHYGKMPGVERMFLQQPGAEIIFRALECRPDYHTEVEQIDWPTNFCYFRVSCSVVHIQSGLKLGSSEGVCSSREFAANCTFKQSNDGSGLVNCPTHGRGAGKVWDHGDSLVCQDKVAQDLSRTVQNVLAKARKRAMVAAIRTVGCVSEMFTQDSDLMPTDDNPSNAPQNAPRSRPARQTPQGGTSSRTAGKIDWTAFWQDSRAEGLTQEQLNDLCADAEGKPRTPQSLTPEELNIVWDQFRDSAKRQAEMGGV